MATVSFTLKTNDDDTVPETIFFQQSHNAAILGAAFPVLFLLLSFQKNKISPDCIEYFLV